MVYVMQLGSKRKLKPKGSAKKCPRNEAKKQPRAEAGRTEAAKIKEKCCYKRIGK